ncbi:MAG: Ig-like domain-containing protein [Planctomycetota bacterium]|nr:Ig-like domain-containing protein [Planctomycetota bacterium]
MNSPQTKLFKGFSFVATLLASFLVLPTAHAQDLNVVSVQEVRTRAFHGDTLRLRRLLANLDAGTAGTFDVQVLLSDDTALDAGDTVLSTFTIANIPGNSLDGPANLTVTIPNMVVPGTYFILLNADSGGAITETNENNNLGSSGAITIEARPGDLNLNGVVQVDDVTAVINEALGGTLSGRGDINNSGNVDIVDVVGSINIVLNTPPSAMADTLTTNEDINNVTFAFPGLLGNDVDMNSNTLQVNNFDMISSNGVPVTVQFNGTVTGYNPRMFPNVDSLALGSTALDSFLYTVTDDQGGFTTAATTIAISGRNDNPVAGDDMFATAYSNTLFGVGQSAPVMVTGTVLANDMDVDIGDTITASAVTMQGGATITMMSDGTFTYLPARNATGPQTFNYTVTDNNGGTDTGTVTIMIFPQRIFYVDANAAAGGDGRNVTPYNSLNGANGAADTTGDIVYVFDDGPTGTTPGAIALLNNQQLLGNVDLIVNGTTIFTAAGTPTLVNAGDLITINGMNVTVRGFQINPSSGSAVTTGNGTPTNIGTLTISNCAINAAAGPAFRCNPTTSGVLAVSLSSVSATNPTNQPNIIIGQVSGSFTAPVGTLTANGNAGQAFRVTNGSATINYGGLINSNPRPNAIDITGTTGGSVTLGGTITIDTPQNGIAFNLANNAGNLIFGETNNVTDGLVSVMNNTGMISFTNVNVDNTATNRSGVDFDDSIVTMGNGTVNSGTGAAFSAVDCALTVNLTAVSSSGSSAPGINLMNTSGSFTITGDVNDTPGSGGIITNNTNGTGAIRMNNVLNPTLENMVIGTPGATADGTANSATNTIATVGISSQTVSNLTILNCLISDTGGSAIKGVNTTTNLTVTNTNFIDCGDTAADEIIDFNNANVELRGTVQFTNCNFLDNSGEIFILDNAGGTTNLGFDTCTFDVSDDRAIVTTISGGTLNLAVQNSTLSNIGVDTTDSGIAINVLGSGNGVYTINNTSFSTISGSGINFQNLGSGASATLTVTGSATSSFTGIGQRGIQVTAGAQVASTTVNLRDLNITSQLQCVLYSLNAGTFNSNITTQNITTNMFTSTGSQAIQVGVDGGSTRDISPRLNIRNSNFTTNDATSRPASFLISNVNSNASIFHLTLDSSTLTGPNLGTVLTMNDNAVFCANFTNNTFDNTGGGSDLILTNNNATDPFQLQGFAGNGTDGAAVFAFLSGQNTFDAFQVNGNVNYAAGTCLLPPAP